MTEGETAAAGVRDRVSAFLAANDPAARPRLDFLRARFDAGLAWVHYPAGLGGLGAPRALQAAVDAQFAAAGAPDNDPSRNAIGLGMAAPTIRAFGSDEQHARWLRPLWTGEEIWCQLFSEPGAGSDLAGLSTRAQRAGGGWRLTGQKIWTSLAKQAAWAICIARTDPAKPRHDGISYFLVDMHSPGIEVRPLREIGG
ncbi:MAG TPA: acyl-CoA dehydrogenase family protein, partial [Streptosporangiaceae bacterium]